MMSESPTDAAAPVVAPPPVTELVAGEGAPPAPEAREQIPDPDVGTSDKPPSPPPAPASPSDSGGPVGLDWKAVADGREAPPPGDSPRKARGRRRDHEEDAAAAAAAAAKAMLDVKRRKAEHYVGFAAMGMGYLARRWGVPKEEIDFTAEEEAELKEALAAVLPDGEEDPWSRLIGALLMAGGPRVYALMEGREKTLGAAAAEEKAAAAAAPTKTGAIDGAP